MSDIALQQILTTLKANESDANRQGMQKFGINALKALGVRLPVIRNIAKKYRYNHELAIKLWETEIHEARMLATMIDNPKEVTEKQIEEWINDFDSWDICDQCCGDLFTRLPNAYQLAIEWTAREKEFVKRAGFVLMARLAVYDKKASDEAFIAFMPYIIKNADDTRPMVRKAINWALRQIGKRNILLHAEAIKVAEHILNNSKNSLSRWIALDALRELNDNKTYQRIIQRKVKI